MKKLIYLLLVVPFLFTSCSEDDVADILVGWEKTFGGDGYDRGNSVQQTTDGGYIITGFTDSFGNQDYYNVNANIYLIKTDGNGNEQWSKTFGGTGSDRGYSVQQTTDGGYIITGDNGQYIDAVCLIKTDGSGIEQWTRVWHLSDQANEANSVQQTTDGGYIITGGKPYATDGVHLIKTDGSGIEQWYRMFDGKQGKSVQQTTDGGYIITGDNGTPEEVYLIKTDGSGIEQWSQTFGGTGHVNAVNSVQQTTDGGYIITGWAYNDSSGDVYLIKTDGSGIEQWRQTFGGADSDRGYSVQQTTDGGYIITGGKGNSVYLIKTDGSGN